jgi:hypothetical protein
VAEGPTDYTQGLGYVDGGRAKKTSKTASTCEREVADEKAPKETDQTKAVANYEMHIFADQLILERAASNLEE